MESLIITRTKHHSSSPRPQIHLKITREDHATNTIIAQLPILVAMCEEVIDDTHARSILRPAWRRTAAFEDML